VGYRKTHPNKATVKDVLKELQKNNIRRFQPVGGMEDKSLLAGRIVKRKRKLCIETLA